MDPVIAATFPELPLDTDQPQVPLAVRAGTSRSAPQEQLVPGATPGPDFYAAHLEELARTLACWLGSRTQAPAARLARGILLLSRDARRLLARLLNRKRGPLRTETLNY
ncbi:MAG: hypothetical protein AAGG11_07910, partial [Pseudomonadota bacterium]